MSDNRVWHETPHDVEPVQSNRFIYARGSTDAQGYQCQGRICNRKVYEGPEGDTEPLFIITRRYIEGECCIEASSKNRYYVQSPFYDVDDADEWADWLTTIKQAEYNHDFE